MADTTDLHMVEVALRDLANIDVILATDRLVMLPSTPDEMRAGMADLERVKEFVVNRVPSSLREPAKLMFMEHVEKLKAHFGVITGGRA